MYFSFNVDVAFYYFYITMRKKVPSIQDSMYVEFDRRGTTPNTILTFFFPSNATES